MNWPCLDEPGDFATCSECNHYLAGNGDCPECGLNFQTFVPVPLLAAPVVTDGDNAQILH